MSQVSAQMSATSRASLNSLDLPGRPQDTRVVVAMSGGVDSSVVAALLTEQGYEVIGVTLQLYDHGEAVAKARSCCAGQDIHDARRVAADLGIPHYVLDYESRFRQSVIDDFADSYLRGETPIPCVRCNQGVKFHDLLSMARDLGGHRIRVNTVVPGWIMTERQKELWATPEALEKHRDRQCLPDLIEPVYVARMVVFLASDDAAMCSANNYMVEAGSI